MKRADKIAAVERMQGEFARAPHLVLAGFQGLSVNQATLLRRRVRQIGGRYFVVKNRLARRAARGTPAEKLAPRFEGPCAVASHESDPVVLVRTLADFAKENPQLELRGGLVDAREVLDAAEVKRLATLPALPELRAQLLALIQTPAATLARLLNTPATQLARVIDARREALAGQGGE